MYELSRLGFILLGLQFCLSAILGFVHSTIDAFSAERPLEEFFASSFAIALFYAALGLAPGIVLLVSNRRIAGWCFPESAPPDLTRRDVLVGSGLAIAGAYLVATGFAEALGFGLAAAMSGVVSHEAIRASLLGNSLGSSASGIVRAVLGFLLAGYSARIARAFTKRIRRDAA